MRKKNIFILGLGIFLLGVLPFISAIEISYCCEKTVDGAWCQNAPEERCDDDFRKVPASCDATSYCKLGCCYDSQEGTCMENTPQKVCDGPEENDPHGIWSGDSTECDIPQCSLGCCLIGDQAAFVTQTRCKRLSSLYGLEINFRTDLSNEVLCIQSATSEVKGACVFEKEYEKTCKFISKRECLEMSSGNETGEFHEGYLCSAENLGTNCGPTEKTVCVEEYDEVYFVDSCGNLANIYDASKIKNKNYWSKIVGKAESCGFGQSNADSSSCGNCDYYLGSSCKAYKVGQDKVRPSYGNNLCRDLGCKYDGEDYEHGETWCIYENQVGKGRDVVGSRHIRAICYNGDVLTEPCADFRQEICLQEEIETTKGEFFSSACVVNRWQDCVAQTNRKNCENIDKRECTWLTDGGLMSHQSYEAEEGDLTDSSSDSSPSSSSSTTTADTTTNSNSTITGGVITGAFIGGIFGGSDDSEEEYSDAPTIIKGACVPSYPPGLEFWSDGETRQVCSQADFVCYVEFAKKGYFFSHEAECVKNCECLSNSWVAKQNRICNGLGDCGAYVNIEKKFTSGGMSVKKGTVPSNFSEGLIEGLYKDLFVGIFEDVFEGVFDIGDIFGGGLGF
ncbi:MAG: hypothetical protein KKF68_00090 [Nanoarchaeota archaeon]|nr:hypothetical protein [Nanoarchaeota archaeon]